jgi:hypothetical protein
MDFFEGEANGRTCRSDVELKEPLGAQLIPAIRYRLLYLPSEWRFSRGLTLPPPVGRSVPFYPLALPFLSRKKCPSCVRRNKQVCGGRGAPLKAHISALSYPLGRPFSGERLSYHHPAPSFPSNTARAFSSSWGRGPHDLLCRPSPYPSSHSGAPTGRNALPRDSSRRTLFATPRDYLNEPCRSNPITSIDSCYWSPLLLETGTRENRWARQDRVAKTRRV